MRIVGIVLLGCLMAVTPALAQGHPRRPWELGVHLGLTPSMASPFSECGRAGQSLSGRVMRRVGARVGLEVGIETMGEPILGGCTIAIADVAPPPQNGTVVSGRWEAGDTRAPFTQAALRVVLTPVTEPSSELRVHAGLGWVAGSRLAVPQAGGSAILGRGRVRWLLEGDFLVYGIRHVQHVTTYQNGSPVSNVATRDRRWFVMPVLRAGVVLGVGGER